MALHTQNERYLRDGAVLIYQRSDVAKPIWHCRIKFPNHPYIRKSLKTQNEEDAVRAASKHYDDLRFRHQRGMPLTSFSFEYALDAYLQWLEDQGNKRARTFGLPRPQSDRIKCRQPRLSRLNTKPGKKSDPSKCGCYRLRKFPGKIIPWTSIALSRPIASGHRGPLESPGANVRFWGYSGHCDQRLPCLLLAKSGHEDVG